MNRQATRPEVRDEAVICRYHAPARDVGDLCIARIVEADHLAQTEGESLVYQFRQRNVLNGRFSKLSPDVASIVDGKPTFHPSLPNDVGHFGHKKVWCYAYVGFRVERLGKRSGLRAKRFVKEPLQRNTGVDDV